MHRCSMGWQVSGIAFVKAVLISLTARDASIAEPSFFVLGIKSLKVNSKNPKVRKQIQAITVNIDRLDNKQMSFQD